MTKRPRIVLFTRWPEPGQCKTRLIPAVGADGAARVHRRLTERTVTLLRDINAVIEIAFTGAAASDFQQWLGADLTYAEQVAGDLTARLLDRIDPAPVLFLGSDTPELARADVAALLAALAEHDVAIGPAEDGGYWGIALRCAHPALFTDMPWSTPRVLPETLRRIADLGLSHHLGAVHADCDTPDDLARWPWLSAA
jgi:rSAM/selenodomain-associated transferase 1